MICSFRDKATEAVFFDVRTRSIPADVHARAAHKLHLLHQASCLDDLRLPPGNALEPLQGDRAGQHSIRINRQWRICFRWDQGAHDVEIVDYHR